MTRRSEMDWTPEKIAELRRMVLAGDSMSEIGRWFGCSKNSVVGKVHRLGDMPKRENPIKTRRVNWRPRGKDTAPRAPQAARPVIVRMAPVAPPPPPVLRLSSRNTCQFPIGDPRKPGFRLCGQRAVLGKPYCPSCIGAAYRPKTTFSAKAAS